MLRAPGPGKRQFPWRGIGGARGGKFVVLSGLVNPWGAISWMMWLRGPVVLPYKVESCGGKVVVMKAVCWNGG